MKVEKKQPLILGKSAKPNLRNKTAIAILLRDYFSQNFLFPTSETDEEYSVARQA
ncbi:hypothetical protein L6250_04240 [Candidatus Parcubacteria bacterium]|nr:hypothetical protein [Patescibacteria group bacterium]MCG2688808.1 hypothetical protein [Candidatus Parcubacteria bacterium]